jgi:hypothetical protein
MPPHHASPLVVERQKSWSRLLYQIAAKILVLAQRLWAGLVFDGLAAVAPSNADHVLPLVEQPLALNRLRVALIVCVRAQRNRISRGPVALVLMESSATLVLVVIQPRRLAR